MNKPQFLTSKDKAGNFRMQLGDPVVLTKDSISAVCTTAAVCDASLAAASGYRYVVDFAKVAVASIAANTTVFATLYDGTTAVRSLVTSANGTNSMVDAMTENVSIMGTSGALIELKATSPGTGGSISCVLGAHKVLANET